MPMWLKFLKWRLGKIRHVCRDCRKTFYNPIETMVHIDIYGDACPHCGSAYFEEV